MFYKKTDYKLLGYQKSKTKNKKYDAILKGKDKTVKVPFGDSRYGNFGDKTGLNLYPGTGDEKKRASYRARHEKDLKEGYYSPGWFSYYILW
jgi:hypothetical protein